MKHRILEFLRKYMLINSLTASPQENDVLPFLSQYLQQFNYFRINIEHFGIHEIKGDPYERGIFWAMVKGASDDTVILLHHSDVADTNDFADFKAYAFDDQKLQDILKNLDLSEEARADLESGNYLFGHGACDMKGGGAIQMDALIKYSEQPVRKGNLILLALPDEESLSAGMREAADLLLMLKEKYNLRYKLVVNSEPHQRKEPDKAVVSLGSSGKLLFFVYVQGVVSHLGKSDEGLSSLGIMSHLISRTDQSQRFTHVIKGERSPTPAWVFLRDVKERYDVSMPDGIFGCMNLLTFNNNLRYWVEQLEAVISEAVVEQQKKLARNFPTKILAFTPDLVNQPLKDKLESQLKKGQLNYLEATMELVKDYASNARDHSPKIVYGLIPPFYPAVISDSVDLQKLVDELKAYARTKFNLELTQEYFYTGLSDLSYTTNQTQSEDLRLIEEIMPFYGDSYKIPFEKLETLNIPSINLGPWGKDFHLRTERVLIEDLIRVFPNLLNHLIKQIFRE
ncbi:MAG: M20/M25/M40 family metallo-hydrolase [Eubacteriales bacterium]|nr:M20/M25/M40 family metallo-hydrolase [Eubacteriales bacterium]